MAGLDNTKWDAKEIEALARTSGKPLEVSVAQAFLKKHRWTARLGTHYRDGAEGEARELDVFAQCEQKDSNATYRFRVLASCRGFPENRSPLCYVLSQGQLPHEPPIVLSSYRLPGNVKNGSPATFTLPDLERAAASVVLSNLGLQAEPRIVAWDTIEREERVPKGQPGSPPVVTHRRPGEGDRRIFSALDSAISAAMSWIQFDKNRIGAGYYCTLDVPLCVLSIPFWTVSIDGGGVGPATVKTVGYQSDSYPLFAEFKEIMAVVCSIGEIAKIVDALDDLSDTFFHEIHQRWSGG
jgi:hypothetical protein